MSCVGGFVSRLFKGFPREFKLCVIDVSRVLSKSSLIFQNQLFRWNRESKPVNLNTMNRIIRTILFLSNSRLRPRPRVWLYFHYGTRTRTIRTPPKFLGWDGTRGLKFGKQTYKGKGKKKNQLLKKLPPKNCSSPKIFGPQKKFWSPPLCEKILQK